MAITSQKVVEEGRADKSLVLYIVLLLLLASVGLTIFGLLTDKKRVKESITQKESQTPAKEEDFSVSEYFEDTSSSIDLSEEGAEFLKEDPFRDMCQSTAGDDLPSVSSNTVCVR